MPAASRLTVRANKNKNRRRPASVWARVPRPAAVANACGRMLRRSLPAIIATTAITAVGGGAYLGYRFVTTSDRFAVTSIEVQGAAQLSVDEVRAVLPVKLGDNIFTTDLDTVTRALRAHPWVAEASVHRMLPDTLVIDIREHRAAALVELGDLYLVDDRGHPFKRTQLDAGDGDGLPVITGLDRASYLRDPEGTAETITSALGVLADWRRDAARPAIGELHVDAHRAITLRTYDAGAAIQLGPLGTSVADRMRAFDAAWAELSADERARVRTLHLDSERGAHAGRPTLRPVHVTVAFAKD